MPKFVENPLVNKNGFIDRWVITDTLDILLLLRDGEIKPTVTMETFRYEGGPLNLISGNHGKLFQTTRRSRNGKPSRSVP